MTGSTTATLAMAVIGLVFGWVGQRTHFCTMGAVADAVLFGSLRRLRAWALAMAVATASTQILIAAGAMDLADTIYLSPRLDVAGLALGGLVFGFGMVLAGGCASRNLVRLGGGSLKALVVLLVMGLVCAASLRGPLSPAVESLGDHGSVDLAARGLVSQAAGELLGGGMIVPWVMAVVFAGFALSGQGLRDARPELVAGLTIGALVPLAWLAAGSDHGNNGLTFVVPVGDTVDGLTGDFSLGAMAAVALVLGTVAGAFASSLTAGSFRIEAFAGRDDMVRHLTGAALMGLGGAAASGCTIGQGVTGIATGSIGAVLCLASLLAGARWGVRYLETGRLLPAVTGSTSR